MASGFRRAWTTKPRKAGEMGVPCLQTARTALAWAGHEAGRAEGYEAGQKAGHEAGRAEGYEAGRKAGRDEAMTTPEPPPSSEA